jgi:hypothetical protein
MRLVAAPPQASCTVLTDPRSPLFEPNRTEGFEPSQMPVRDSNHRPYGGRVRAQLPGEAVDSCGMALDARPPK